jgi:hypothetical protein
MAYKDMKKERRKRKWRRDWGIWELCWSTVEKEPG